MTLFIEQIDPNLESAARVRCGNRTHVLAHPVLPLAPGILAASAGAGAYDRAVRTHLLTAGLDSQTLVVALYYSARRRCARAARSGAMAMVCACWSRRRGSHALRFVNPTQLVSAAGTSAAGMSRPSSATPAALLSVTRASHTTSVTSASASHLGIGAVFIGRRAPFTRMTSLGGATVWGICGVSLALARGA